ncbi:MAG: hypothetical protein A3F74_10450 [Betaproteobacteria bacterium RIFCSPLOWO2_12_FULL_62_58]|nr:MAG: hypothetical protein A3F74_10450 [Betaproteobacteria bacterium RIFCSPLOWO2_12_FULL_62_58]
MNTRRYSAFHARDIVAALAVLLGFVGTAWAAQPTYPNKAIRILVPFTAGGLTDILGRGIGERLTAAWGQPVVVDNRPGADGMLATQIVSKANPDGYTLLMIGLSYAANPSVHRNLPYDTVRDFTPVILAADAPMVLAVHPEVKANTVSELVALARAKPGQINFASGGTGSSQHLAAVLFEITAKVELYHIQYKGAAPAVTDLLGGRVQMMFAPLAQSTQHAKAGRLKLLGVTSPQRVAFNPELPTIMESVPGYEARAWYGLAAPSGVPKDIVLKLNGKIAEELRGPVLSEKLMAMGLVPGGGMPDEFAAFIRNEMTKYAAVVKKAGIKLD